MVKKAQTTPKYKHFEFRTKHKVLEKTVKNTIRTILLWIHYKSLKDREDQTGTTKDQQREPTSSK